jgi:DNA-binding CsgD family transcriptional regulator
MRHAPDAAEMRGRILVGTWRDDRRGRRQYAVAAQQARITILGSRREGSEPAAPPDRQLRGRPLTTRERLCIGAVADGLTFATAAARLGVPKHTVRDDLQRAKAKLGARSTAHLVALAVADGLVHPTRHPDARTPHPRDGR